MPSIHVRGQANLHDSAEGNSCNNSNKRQRVHSIIGQSSIRSLNMQPDQEVNDIHHAELLPKQVAARGAEEKEEEAAALLHHLHHADDHHASADRMHIDHDHDYHGAPGDRARVILDRGMLRPAAHGARETSGSSDSSAAYFSGDSDLTAEPIMGRCTTDDNGRDGAKSSNSGSSSTPILKRKNSLTLHVDQTHQPPFSAGLGALQANCGNLPVFNEKMCNANDEAAYPSQMAHTTALIAPSTSTTSASRERTRMQHVQEQQTMSSCRQCSISPRPELYADSGRKLTESWLELRLGFSHESIRQGPMQAVHIHNDFGDEKRKLGEAEYIDAMEQERVTLQLLPEGHPNSSETCSGGKGIKPFILAQEPPVNAAISGLSPSSIPQAFHPSTSTFSPHINATHFNMNPHSMTSVSCGHPVLQNLQARDPSSAPSQYLDQFLHLNQTSNQSYQHLPRLPASYEQRAIAYNPMQESNGQRRWASTESLDMMQVAGAVQPPTSMDLSASAQPPEVYRPTASLGWPPGTALVPGAEGRPWSASSIHSAAAVPQAQLLQNNMSWQGLLRSMANDPLLHAHNLRGMSMQSFNNGAILQTSGMRRRHMFPPAYARSPSSHVTPSAAAAPQRLQLTSLRRSTDLWFSLQEADQDFANEDQLSHHPKQKLYLRIRDGKMQISVVKSYLISKLGSAGMQHDEVEITCRGQILSPSLTMQHVRDTIWFNKDVEIESIGFQYTTRPINDSQNRVMTLCYQRHHTSQAITLNLLKI